MHRMRIGTRGSKLALWQAHHVADLLRAASPGMDVSVEVVKTKGDRILGVALSKIGDKGLFTKELEQALFDGRVDVCVHSMKDVPTALPEGLALAGCLIRADARDVLVAASGTTFAGLPAGSRVGTGALRRLSQLRAVRDDLDYVEVRGNLDTRIAKVRDGALDAVVLAAAGIERMGWSRRGILRRYRRAGGRAGRDRARGPCGRRADGAGLRAGALRRHRCMRGCGTPRHARFGRRLPGSHRSLCAL